METCFTIPKYLVEENGPRRGRNQENQEKLKINFLKLLYKVENQLWKVEIQLPEVEINLTKQLLKVENQRFNLTKVKSKVKTK